MIAVVEMCFLLGDDTRAVSKRYGVRED